MVLIARSPVFKDMLYCSSNKNYMDISDLDASTLKRLLTVLYTGTLEPNLRWEDSMKLYNAADKFQVQSLKDWCFSIFRFDVSVSNVIDVLRATKNYVNNELIVFVHDFVIGRLNEVVQSKEWKCFIDNDSVFAKKTMHAIHKRKFSMGKKLLDFKNFS